MKVHQRVFSITLRAVYILALSFLQAHAGIEICPNHQIPFINLPGEACPECSPKKDLSPEEIRQSIAGWNKGSLQLFQKLAADTSENRVVTSHSIQEMLSMLAAGSEDKTQKRLTEIMGVTPETLVNALRLQTMDNKSSRGRFARYNMIAMREGYTLDEAYQKFLGHYFDKSLDVRPAVNFTDQAVVAALTTDVNDKVCKLSEGKITDCLDPARLSQENPGLLMTNVTYFSYPWRDDYESTTGDFHLHDGSTMKTTMFTGDVHVTHAEHNGWRAITLPYESDFKMIAILPPQGVLPTKLTPEILHQLYDERKPRRVIQMNMTIPEHEFLSKYNLTQVLSTEQDGDPFSQGANFTPMENTGSVWVGTMIHRAFIKTDKYGSTGYGVTTTDMVDGETPEITFDRPFLFIIRDDNHQAIRFIGQVYRPNEA